MEQGFSLIELLIVFVITSILACIAYPSYCDYIIRVHRIDGQSALLDLANRMERFYATENSYQTATIGTGNTTDVLKHNVSPEGWYTLTITQATDSTFTLQATPVHEQATRDTHCQSFTFNQLGIKGIAQGAAGAPTAGVAECW